MAAATSEVKGREGGWTVSLAPCVGAKRMDRASLVGAPPLPCLLAYPSAPSMA